MKKTGAKLIAAVLSLVMLMLPLSVFAEEGVTYEIMGELEVGTKTYESSVLDYTVIYFEPAERGKYTISTTNSLVAIVSYNGLWITTEPTAQTVTETSIIFECNALGQSVFVAALSKAEGIDITVSYEKNEIYNYPIYHYETKHHPEAFVLAGNADELEYVNVEDGVEDLAVLGADGFYHLNSEKGPILYASLDDPMVSFYNMREPGQLSSVVYKEDGTVDYKVDYNAAFDEYWACSDVNTALYPLTADLIIMFCDIGYFHGWYGEDGWLGSADEDAWMFACRYFEPYGDADGDGVVSLRDILFLRQYISGIIDDDEINSELADVDGDGWLSVKDVLYIRKYLAGIITEFPVK